jgi:hypothetical protein
MTNAEAKARNLIAGLTLEDLITQFEMTETINDKDIYMVRGWMMDELENRNPKAYEEWLDGYTESPRQYYL